MTNEEHILAAIDPRGYVHYSLFSASDPECLSATAHVSFHVDAVDCRFLAGVHGAVDIIDPDTTLPRPLIRLSHGGIAALLSPGDADYDSLTFAGVRRPTTSTS